MKEIISKLVDYLRNSPYKFLIDYDPDFDERTNFSIFLKPSGAKMELYIEIANFTWSRNKIFVSFTPGTGIMAELLTNVLADFDPNR